MNTEVRDIFRINTKNEENKPIIVEFTTALTKEKFITSSKKYNIENKNDRLNTGLLEINGPPKTIYISENLSPKTRRLFFLARDFSKTYDYSFCWVSHGKVFMRKREGHQYVRIDTEDDLAKLKSKDCI